LPWGFGHSQAWQLRSSGHGCGWGRCFAWGSSCGDQDLDQASKYRDEGGLAYRMAKEQWVRVHSGTVDGVAYQGSRREQSRCSMVDDELAAWILRSSGLTSDR
jgi:hypothetical protein